MRTRQHVSAGAPARSIPACVSIASALALVFALSVPGVAQPNPADNLGFDYQLTYSLCLDPVDPPQLAFNEREQEHYPLCRRWSTFEQLTTRIENADLPDDTKDQKQAVQVLTEKTASEALRADLNSYISTDIYRTYARQGWLKVPDEHSKSGSIAVWKGMIAIVTQDLNEPGHTALERLVVRYPRYDLASHAFTLKEITARYLDNSIRRRQGARHAGPLFLVPGYRLSAYWNSWVTNVSTQQAPDDGHLEVGAVYSFSLDLAALDYSRPAIPDTRRASDQGFRRLTAIPEDLRTIKVFAIPFGGIDLPPSTADQRRIVLSRLSEVVPPSPSLQDISALSTAYSALAPLDERPESGRVTIRVVATAPGCAGVLFTIWNSLAERHIGYVVHPVEITLPHESPTGLCQSASTVAVGVDAPRLSRLDTSTGRESDATLLAFEIDDHHSVVAYSDRATDYTFQWALPFGFTHDLEAFGRAMTQAHKYPRSYDPAENSRELEHILFGSDSPEAGRAKEALRTLASSSSPTARKRLLVRVANIKNQLLFAPINLLTVEENATTTIGEVLDISQPLSLLQETPGACLDTWYAAFDKTSPDFVLTPFPYDDPPKSEVFTSTSQLKDYLGGRAAPSERGEGLLLYAHHDQDEIRLQINDVFPALPSAIARSFPKKSIAVLASCAVASLGSDTGGRNLLWALNHRGVGSAVVSPFGVPETVGCAFLESFRRAVVAGHANAGSWSLFDLVHIATDGVASDERLSAPERLMVQEFVIAGDGETTLCVD